MTSSAQSIPLQSQAHRHSEMLGMNFCGEQGCDLGPVPTTDTPDAKLFQVTRPSARGPQIGLVQSFRLRPFPDLQLFVSPGIQLRVAFPDR